MCLYKKETVLGQAISLPRELEAKRFPEVKKLKKNRVQENPEKTKKLEVEKQVRSRLEMIPHRFPTTNI